MTNANSKSVAIIGGGFTGAAVAFHLAQRGTRARITVFEPRPALGAGLAYGTEDPAHRINVPASKMSLIPGNDRHFVDWIGWSGAVDDDPDARSADGHLYVRRELFGRYVAEHVKSWVSAERVAHVERAVVAVTARGDGGWFVKTADGRQTGADAVVMATTHPPPSVPAVVRGALRADPRVILDAYKPGSLATIPPDARVIIVGTGLTMADVVATLDRQQHRGSILAVSRRGLLPRTHAVGQFAPFGEFTRGPPRSALKLLRRVRRTVNDAVDLGLPWQAVIDAVRAQASEFWPAMPVAERHKIVRYLRPYWDVHRFRIAPQPASVIERLTASGRFVKKAAALHDMVAAPDALRVTLRPRGSKALEAHDAEYLVLTTGPAHESVVRSEPYLASLAELGHIAPDAIGLGLACDARGRAISENGTVNADLFVAGPLARATFGELMGLPQVTSYAVAIAREVIDALAHDEVRPSPAPTYAQAVGL